MVYILRVAVRRHTASVSMVKVSSSIVLLGQSSIRMKDFVMKLRMLSAVMHRDKQRAVYV